MLYTALSAALIAVRFESAVASITAFAMSPSCAIILLPMTCCASFFLIDAVPIILALGVKSRVRAADSDLG